jgi:signal transduction histidine kinase
MSRNKPYQNRLEELFSSTEPVPPEPVIATPPPAIGITGAGDQPVDQGAQVTYTDTSGTIDRDLSRVIEIGRELAQEQNLAKLLDRAADLTAENFDLYGVQIYLSEPTMDRLVLRGASGAQGKQLCLRGHSLAIDAHTPAGVAFTTEQPVAVPDAALNEWFQPVALAGEADGKTTLSAELALPLLITPHAPVQGVRTERAFGVLVLQSSLPGAFSASRQLVFEVLASRLAAAIEALRLYAQAATLQEETRARMGWDEFLDAINRKENIGYSYAAAGSEAEAEVEAETVAELTGRLPVKEVETISEQALTTRLQVGSETIGTLQLERDSKGKTNGQAWESGEVELVKSVADRVAQHLENLRLLAQAERYRAEAEEAARRLTREGWETYLESPQMPASGFIYDQEQVKPLEEETDAGVQATLGLTHTTTGAIKVRDELIGEMAVANIEQPDELAAGIMAVVTERLGTHIENLRLLEETERSRQQLDKRAAELETVARVSTAATTILSPQELLQSVVDLTKYSFNLYHTHVYLLDEHKEALVLKAGAGKTGHRMVSEGEKIALTASKSVVARAAQTRTGVVVNDIRQDQGFLAHSLLPDALSEMAIPMVVGDTLVGVFDVLASVTDRFTAEDMRTFNTLASQVAVALRNAELYAEQMATVVRLRELDHLKSSFLANMSHELRTPLNSILGFAQVILEGLDGPLTPDMSNDLGLIDKNGQHLLILINEILDMAKIEAGRLSLSPEPVNLRSLLEDVVESTASLAREKSLYLRIDSEEQADVTLMLDYTRMRQVFINLIGNATKFTDKGGVSITCEKQASKVSIRFNDTGIGIPPNKLDMIFEQFSQVDTSTTRKAGGTGLGLPISRRLVELHGGRLFATSTGVEGEGSVFTVELPVTQASKV